VVPLLFPIIGFQIIIELRSPEDSPCYGILTMPHQLAETSYEAGRFATTILLAN
jgi:hypothetical protein